MALQLIRSIDKLASVEEQIIAQDDLSAIRTENSDAKVAALEAACAVLSVQLADVIRDLLVAARDLKLIERR